MVVVASKESFGLGIHNLFFIDCFRKPQSSNAEAVQSLQTASPALLAKLVHGLATIHHPQTNNLSVF
jgi:hypothetical protein